MAAVGFADQLVRDYLLFRGFMSSLKTFDLEVKTDKDKGFRPDKIVDHFTSCITSFDLTGLRESWMHLDQRVLCRLEHSFLAAAKKLETALLRMYVVNCISTNRQEKLQEFFEKMAVELQNSAEWKDWFALPFLKSPEDNPLYMVYFTRQWQDTMFLSLHNFLAVVFQSMAMPTLLSYEDELLHLSSLQEENESLRQKLAALGVNENDKTACKDFPPHQEVMDDFFVIAQETPAAESQSRSFRSLIRNIGSGLPTSPLLGRRPGNSNGSRRHTVDDSAIVKPTSAVKPKPRAPSQPPSQSGHSQSLSGSGVAVARVRPQLDVEAATRSRASKSQTREERFSRSTGNIPERNETRVQAAASLIYTFPDQKGSLLLLSQEEFGEHHSCITHCKFNCSGTIAASSDMEGVIKVWSPNPTPQTISSVLARSSVLSLEWASKREKLLLHGNLTGHIRLYDVKDRRTIAELGSESNSPLKDQRIRCIVCNPSDTHFVCSTTPPLNPNGSSSNIGKLLLYDLRTLQLDRNFPIESSPTTCNCCVFNHNGQLLVTGTADGRISLFDVRSWRSLASWNAHNGETFGIQFSADETSCYSMGADGKFVQWSVNKTGEKMSEIEIHPGATGPFIIGGQNVNQKHPPLGKMFAFDSNGNNVLTCGPAGGLVYKISCTEPPGPILNLGGHRWPVVTLDWSTTVDCGTCLTGSLDGKIQVSTLLAQ